MNSMPVFASSADAASSIAHFFETLTPQSLVHLDRLYAPDARFKDPFNEVQGLVAIAAIFQHMFATVQTPRFVVTDRVVQPGACFLVWEFHFAPGKPGADPVPPDRHWVIRGGSHLLLDAAHRITLHRDYWDAAEELYAKLPLIGPVMRWLQRRARVPAPGI